MFDQFSRFILPIGIVVLLVINTIATCTGNKFRESTNAALRSIQSAQSNMQTAIGKIDSANMSVRMTLDTLAAVEQRLRKAHAQMAQIDEAYRDSKAKGDALMKELDKQIKEEQERLAKFRRPR